MERKNLIKFRGDKSRLDVAKDLEITPQMLGAIERGDRTPSLRLAKRIADYYNETIDFIFFDVNDTNCFIDTNNRKGEEENEQTRYRF